jgi:hypothetical protein
VDKVGYLTYCDLKIVVVKLNNEKYKNYINNIISDYYYHFGISELFLLSVKNDKTESK